MAKTALRRGTQDEGNTDYFTGCPIGGGFLWYGLPSKIPSNCRVCDNSTLAISSYAKLNENLGGAWGTSGANLNIPDLRGRFPRGVDGGIGNDPDRASRTGPNAGQNTADAVGSVQDDAMQRITGSKAFGTPGAISDTGSGALGHTFLANNNRPFYDSSSAQTRSLDFDSSNSPGAKTSTETRPKNANVYFVIRVS